MPPKNISTSYRKGQASVGPSKRLKKEPSSESDMNMPEGDTIQRFRGPEEQKVFDTILKSKRSTGEREVILTDFPNTELQHLIEATGWHKLASTPHRAYPLLVKEFLANFNHAIEAEGADSRYKTWVRGRWIEFSPAVIERVLELTRDGIEPIQEDIDIGLVTRFLYGRQDAVLERPGRFVHGELTDTLRILHIFICHNIDPTSHRTTFNEERARLIHHLALGRKLDLGRHIFDFITTLASQLDTTRGILFPSLISVICLVEGVELLPHEEPDPLEATISRRTRESTRGPRVPRALAPALAEPAPAPAQPGDDMLLRQILSEMAMMGRTQNTMRDMLIAHQTQIDNIERQQQVLVRADIPGEQRLARCTLDELNTLLLRVSARQTSMENRLEAIECRIETMEKGMTQGPPDSFAGPSHQ